MLGIKKLLHEVDLETGAEINLVMHLGSSVEILRRRLIESTASAVSQSPVPSHETFPNLKNTNIVILEKGFNLYSN